MVMSPTKTVDAYLASLPEDRRKTIRAVRDVVRKSLPKGFEEGMGFGMIYYSVPLSRFPATYNGHPLAYVGLAAQKNHNALYLMGVYGDGTKAKRFKEGFANAGKKLDMGKSCVRFKTVDDLALDAIADAIAAMSVDEYVELYEKSRLLTKKGQAKAAKKSAKKRVATNATKKT